MPLVHKTILPSPTNLVENGPTTKQINLKTQPTTDREIENQSSQPKEFEIKKLRASSACQQQNRCTCSSEAKFFSKRKEGAKTEKRLSLI
jgi:copper oxidase (laccase) domain-containing protein